MRWIMVNCPNHTLQKQWIMGSLIIIAFPQLIIHNIGAHITQLMQRFGWLLMMIISHLQLNTKEGMEKYQRLIFLNFIGLEVTVMAIAPLKNSNISNLIQRQILDILTMRGLIAHHLPHFLNWTCIMELIFIVLGLIVHH